jgi:hypothetical protein
MAAVLIVTGTALAGCSPNPRPHVALSVDGDNVVAIVAVCSGDWISRLVAFVDDNNVPGQAWAIEMPLTAPESSSNLASTSQPVPAWPSPAATNTMLTVTLFNPPLGWTVADSTLTGLQAGRRYAVRSSSSQNNQASTSFTLADLDGLGDKVWTRRGSSFAAVTRSEFETAAFDNC